MLMVQLKRGRDRVEWREVRAPFRNLKTSLFVDSLRFGDENQWYVFLVNGRNDQGARPIAGSFFRHGDAWRRACAAWRAEIAFSSGAGSWRSVVLPPL